MKLRRPAPDMAALLLLGLLLLMSCLPAALFLSLHGVMPFAHVPPAGFACAMLLAVIAALALLAIISGPPPGAAAPDTRSLGNAHD